MDISIVIVNWNTGPLLRECLDSISQADLPADTRLESVVVVDNASIDGSAEDLPRTLPLRLVRNRENRGFASACNQGAQLSRSECILFLNPDTRLFRDSLSTPLAWLASPSNARVGIVGIQLLDEHGRLARTCARFPKAQQFAAAAFGIDRVFPSLGHQMHEWDHATTRPVDQVIGAFFLVRRPLFDSLGGFDERFFVYFEEVDFSLRARQAGYETVYIASAQAWHLGGGSSRRVKAARLFYSLRSRLAYARKHFGSAELFAMHAITFLLEPFSRSLLLLATGRLAEIRDVVRGYAMLLKDLGGSRKHQDPGSTR